MALQHLRSSTANKRPVPGNMSDGQLGINTNLASPGLFFKDTNGDLVKVGPVHVGTTAPNASPAAGGTAGNSVGEQWLDTSGGTYVFKVWDGSAWRSESGTFVDVNGDVMTGALGIIAGSAGSPGLYFSGDPNTGIYSPGADQLALSTNGTGRLFVDSLGLVSIGDSGQLVIGKGESAIPTNSVKAHIFWGPDSIYGGTSGDLIMMPRSSAAANLRIYTGSTTPSERFRITGTGQLSHIGAGSTGSPAVSFNGSAPSNSLVITSAGLVGIGTSSPSNTAGFSQQVQITGNLPCISIDNSGTGARKYSLGVNGSGAFGIWDNTASAYRAIVDSSGRVGIGNTGPSYKLDVTGGFRVSGVGTTAFSVDASSPNNSLIVDSSGRCLVGTSTARTDIGSNQTATIQTESTVNGLGFFTAYNQNNAFGSVLAIAKSRGTTVGSNTIVQSGDQIGGVFFYGADGVDTARAGGIECYADGGISVTAGSFVVGRRYKIATIGTTDFTLIGASANTVGVIFQATGVGTGTGTATTEPYANSMPGRLVFSVTADNAASPTEALRISSNRAITVSDGGHIVLGTGTGTKIGTATTQKLGFYNATPVVQPAAVADATDAATVITQLNDLLAKLRTLGIIAT